INFMCVNPKLNHFWLLLELRRGIFIRSVLLYFDSSLLLFLQKFCIDQNSITKKELEEHFQL
ncbi:MAG TPA: hypothetical protein VFY68_05690, partial [Nitrososphaeraceae archaeon]|nr:hypothetical protein [Nitrososphaeraceae archaeon]